MQKCLMRTRIKQHQSTKNKERSPFPSVKPSCSISFVFGLFTLLLGSNSNCWRFWLTPNVLYLKQTCQKEAGVRTWETVSLIHDVCLPCCSLCFIGQQWPLTSWSGGCGSCLHGTTHYIVIILTEPQKSSNVNKLLPACIKLSTCMKN